MTNPPPSAPPGQVLVTRPQPGAAATAARLTALGFTPLVAPALAVRPVATALPDPAGIQAVLVTSANALPGLPATLHARPLLAVGAATAHAATRAGFTNVISADADAAALGRLAIGCCNPAGPPLLLASGRGQGAALATTLRHAGFTLHHARVYATRPVTTLDPALRTAWQAGAISAALFLSAATARAFVRLITQADLAAGAARIQALVIGAPAAAALHPLPWRQVRVALTPDQDALLALLT